MKHLKLNKLLNLLEAAKDPNDVELISFYIERVIGLEVDYKMEQTAEKNTYAPVFNKVVKRREEYKDVEDNYRKEASTEAPSKKIQSLNDLFSNTEEATSNPKDVAKSISNDLAIQKSANKDAGLKQKGVKILQKILQEDSLNMSQTFAEINLDSLSEANLNAELNVLGITSPTLSTNDKNKISAMTIEQFVNELI